ncbi:MAG TPA: cytochrome c/FTR1 family iron permease [Gemmatimonadaceae bacterium]|nr:cytochrome c/FTR1 family iron permease [Gemmatimonadaceae bacterium]
MAAVAAAAFATCAIAQESPAKRLGNIVAVAVEEYGKGVDAYGRLVMPDEYSETVDFLADARATAVHLNGADAPAIRALLDSLSAAVHDTVPPARLASLHQRFAAALGEAAAIDLPVRPIDLVDGRAVYAARCASCHGDRGLGDGPAAAGIRPPPPAIGDPSVMRGVSPALFYRVVSAGVSGTAMPAWGETLTAEQRWNVVGYVLSLQGVRSVCATCAASASASIGVMAALDSAVAAARAGRASDARERAVDAYLAFEPMETAARAKSPGLVSAMERRFADFRAQVKAGDVPNATRTRDRIAATLPAMSGVTERTSGTWEAFLQSFVIIVREGFEAILVIGAIVAFLVKTGHRDRLRAVWYGAGAGVIASAATAVILKTLLAAVPASQDLIEGVSMLVAMVVLFWVSYWLISKVEAEHWQHFIREKVTAALASGGATALAFVAFLAVYREGAETALFYQALLGDAGRPAGAIALGIGAGALVLAAVFTAFYRYGVKIPLRPFFTITSGLLYAMAFIFAGRGVAELQEVNVLPISAVRGVPRIEALGIYPTVESLGLQAVLVALLAAALIVTFRRRRGPAAPSASASSRDGARTRRTARRRRDVARRDT